MLRQKNKHTKEDVETKEEEKEEGEHFSLLYSSMSLSMVCSWVNLGKDLDLSCFRMQSFRQKLFIALQYCKTEVDSAFCPVVLLVCIFFYILYYVKYNKVLLYMTCPWVLYSVFLYERERKKTRLQIHIQKYSKVIQHPWNRGCVCLDQGLNSGSLVVLGFGLTVSD